MITLKGQYLSCFVITAILLMPLPIYAAEDVEATAAALQQFAGGKSSKSKVAAKSLAVTSKAAPVASDLEKRVVTHKPSSLAEEASSGQIDVIATVDAPMQTNILSWQDTDKYAPKNDIEFSALKDALMPTDRDRLSDEVRYSQILNQPEK